MGNAAKTIFGVVIISIVCVFVPGFAEAEVLPRTAKLVPPETVLLVEVDNFSQLKQQFEKTNFYKLYNDPAMAGFVDDVKTKWREKMRGLDNKLAEVIANADVLPQGRVAVALVLNEQTIDADEPPFLFITQWGEAIAEIKEAVEKIVQKAIEDGAHRTTEDYRGLSIETITNGQSPPLSYSLFDDCLIGSMNLDVLKFVIAHIKGATSPTLADDADYTTAITAIGPYHDIDFYVSIKQIIKTVIAEDTTGKTQTTIANLGLDNIVAAGCSIGLARGPGSSCRGKAFLKIDGAKKGLCKMLEVESAVLRAPRFVPATTYSATFLNLNIKKAYNELYNILYSFNPTTAAMMHTPLLPPSPEGDPGLQIKADVIDHLGSQIVIAQSTKKPSSNVAAPAPTESLVALAIVNRRALEKSLSLLHGKMIAPNNPDASRELLGHTIYRVPMTALPFFPTGLTPMQAPAELAAPQMPTLAFTVTDNHLIFGTEPAVEQVIRTLSSTEAVSVGSAKWFTSAKLAIPSVVGLAYLEDNAASGEFLWRMMKQSGKSSGKNSNATMGISITPNPGMIFSQVGLDLCDFGLLPEFDVVRKYFGLSVSYGISRPDGFFFEFKELYSSNTK